MSKIFGNKNEIPLYIESKYLGYLGQSKTAKRIETIRLDCEIFKVDKENKEVLEGAF